MTGVVNVPLFFEEDAVMLYNPGSRSANSDTRRGWVLKCGIVVQSFADVYSDDELSSDEDEPVGPGCVRVAFYPSGSEQLLEESKLQLIDRSLMPGDIIRRIDSEAPKGFVSDCNVICYLQIKGTDKVISSGVSSKLLSDIRDFGDEAVYVELDNWIGRTVTKHNDSHVRLTLKLPNGDTCVVNADKVKLFIDLLDTALRKIPDSEFTFTSYYKGQRLRGPKSRLRSIAGTKRSKEQVMVTVIDVEITKVVVDWLVCSALSDGINPGSNVTGEALTRMRVIDPFAYAAAEIGDSYYYTIRSEDEIETFGMKPTPSQLLLQQMISRHFNKLESDNDQQKPVTLVSTASGDDIKQEADVVPTGDLGTVPASEEAERGSSAEEADQITGNNDEDGWEDVEDSSDDSSDLIKAKSIGRDRALYKTADPSIQINCSVGEQVAVEVVLTESFADIIWQDGTSERNVSSRDLYPVYYLDDNEFFTGDYVVRADVDESEDHSEYGVIISVEESQRLANVQWFNVSQSDGVATRLIQTEQVSVYELKDHKTFVFRPGACVLRTLFDDKEDMQCCQNDVIGSVIQLHCDGTMSIKWADGCVSQCYPDQLMLVANTHESDDEDDSSGDSSSDSSDDSEAEDSDEKDEDSENDKSSDNMFNIFNDSLTSLAGKYDQVLASIKDIQVSRYAISWKDFDQILNPLCKASDIYKKMIVLEYSMQNEIVSFDSNDIENFDRMLTKYRAYSSLSRCMMLLMAKLSEEVPTYDFGLVVSFHRFIQSVLIDLSSFPDIKDEAESAYLETLMTLVTKVSSLEHLIIPVGQPSLTNTKEVEEMCSSKGLTSSPAPTVHAGASSSSSTEGAECDKLKAEIIQIIKDLDQSARLNVQLEIIDFAANFFAQMKDIVSTLVTMCPSAVPTDTAPASTCAEGDLPGTSSVPVTHQSTLSASTGHETDNIQGAAGEDVPKQTPLSIVDDDKLCSKALLDETLISDGPSDVQDVSATPIEFAPNLSGQGKLVMMESCPPCHRFYSMRPTSYLSTFHKRVREQLQNLSNNLPEGITVKAYEDRMNCLSALITGPSKTPYEGALFMFDLFLPNEYPAKPPLVYYYSYTSERINPNLYVDGKVCISLLGTWNGKQHELWSPLSSSLLQVLVSIQGLILVNEPYYNEAGYEKQRGTTQGNENSKKYNEMVLVKTLESTVAMLKRPHPAFDSDVVDHWTATGQRFIERITSYMDSNTSTASRVLPATTASAGTSVGAESKDIGAVCDGAVGDGVDVALPDQQLTAVDYPLLPLSKGCMLTLNKLLVKLKEAFKEKGNI